VQRAIEGFLRVLVGQARVCEAKTCEIDTKRWAMGHAWETLLGSLRFNVCHVFAFFLFPVFFLVWVGNNCKICGVSAHWQPRSCSTANASKRLNLIKPRQTIRSKKRHGLAVVICRVRQLAMAKSKDDGPGRRPLNRKKINKELMMPCYGRSFCNLLFWASFATATG